MRDVLFDPAQPTEVVDAVFNDLLNRPESVQDRRGFARILSKI